MSNETSSKAAGRLLHLVGDDRLQVERRDLLLLVRQLLEALEGGVEGGAVDLEAQLLERVAQGVAAGVLAEHERVRLEPDRGGVHDLVGGALLQHAVLVDAGLVREGVAAHDRLVRLHLVAGQAGHHAAGARDLARVHAGPEPVRGLAHVEQHHDLLERRVPRALADAVDRALHLAASGPHAGERVGHRHAEVVVAVHRGGHVGEAGHEPVQLAPHLRVLVGHRVADRVRHVDGGGALVESDLEHLGGELELGARGVHRRELHVLAVRARLRHGCARLALHVLAARLKLVLDVDVARRDEGVDARALGVLDGVPGRVHVLRRSHARGRRSRGRAPRGRWPGRPRSPRARRSGSRPRSRPRRAARAGARSRASPAC